MAFNILTSYRGFDEEQANEITGRTITAVGRYGIRIQILWEAENALILVCQAKSSILNWMAKGGIPYFILA